LRISTLLGSLSLCSLLSLFPFLSLFTLLSLLVALTLALLLLLLPSLLSLPTALASAILTLLLLLRLVCGLAPDHLDVVKGIDGLLARLLRILALVRLPIGIVLTIVASSC